jgi:hypothetical protein
VHGTLKSIIRFDDFGSLPSFNTPASKSVIAARTLLKEAREIIFPDRGWQHLPQTERGWRILRWGADQAWLAWPADPKAGVIRWCSFAAPWLSDADLDAIVARTKTSNKRYSPDDSARVLEITVADKVRLDLRQSGANDDPFYAVRNRIKLEKDAARKRESRAKTPSTGKRGRPALDLSPEERLARLRAQKADYARRRRVENKSVTPQDRVCSGTELNSTQASSEPKKKRSAGARHCGEPAASIGGPLFLGSRANATLSSRGCNWWRWKRTRPKINSPNGGMPRSSKRPLNGKGQSGRSRLGSNRSLRSSKRPPNLGRICATGAGRGWRPRP